MINFVFLLVFVALCAASIFGWQSVARSRKSGLPFGSDGTGLVSPLGLVDVGIMFMTWLAGQMIGVMWLQLSGNSSLNSPEGPELALLIGIMAICQLGSTGLGLAILLFRYRSLQSLGLSCRNWRSEVKLGLFAFILVVPPLLVLQWSLTYFVDYSHASMEALKDNPTWLTISAVWCGAVISAPICEEVFFRGILQPWLQKIFAGKTSLETLIAGGWALSAEAPTTDYSSMLQTTEGSVSSNSRGAAVVDASNPYLTPRANHPLPDRNRSDLETSADGRQAIFLSSLIFAAVHIGQGLAPIPLFLMGIVLGYLYLKTNNLLPCIVLHMGLNAFSMFWFTVSLFA
jgi:membrane protease YdiL (CAAX protease family)